MLVWCYSCSSTNCFCRHLKIFLLNFFFVDGHNRKILYTKQDAIYTVYWFIYSVFVVGGHSSTIYSDTQHDADNKDHYCSFLLWGVSGSNPSQQQNIVSGISHGVPQCLQANADMASSKCTLQNLSNPFTDVKTFYKGSFSKQRSNKETVHPLHQVFKIKFPEN
jgi:hypothetical protein